MANRLRQDVIEMVSHAGSGHIAGPLDMADIFTAFYFHILNHNPKKPQWPDRDRLMLSNGHICPIQYAALAHAGYFKVEELENACGRLGHAITGPSASRYDPGRRDDIGPAGFRHFTGDRHRARGPTGS